MSIFGGWNTSQQTAANAGASSFIDSIYASAKGNVFSEPGISAYSSTVVSQPTLFPFAHGIGLMGEAGAEAVMPLSRGADGKLGVKAQGAGPAAIEVVLNVTNNGQDTSPKASAKMDGNKVIVDLILDTVSGDTAKGGRTAKAMQQRFGLQRRGVPVGA